MAELFNAQTAIIVLAALASFSAIVAFTLPYLQTDQRAARLKSVAKRREELSEQQRARYQQKATRDMRQQRTNLLKRVVDSLRLHNIMDSQMVRDRLLQAGYRGELPKLIFTVAHVAIPLGIMVVTALFVLGPGGAEFALATKIIICLGGGLIGFLAPTILLSNLISKRQQSITKGFPDALDLLVICVEAGSSMEAAFNRVADELGDISAELCEEFGMCTAELQFLSDRREALDKLAVRTGLPAVKALTTSLIQAEKYGTPLAMSLRVLSLENRDARMAVAEKKAGALPAMLTVPMIVFFLPVLFIVLLGPAVIKTLERF